MHPVARLLFFSLLIAAPAVEAMMAGAPPDTPAARIIPAEALGGWPGLGEVITANGRFSGVAVSRWHVLTAAHVAAAARLAPQSLSFVAAERPHAPVLAERIDIFPGYAMPANDLALITLATPLPRSVSTAVVRASPLSAGETIDLAGAGGAGPGPLGRVTDRAPGAFRWGRNMADLVGPHVPGVKAAGHFLFYDFDGPVGNGMIGGPTLGNPVETLVAGGDSGGPIYVHDEDANVRWLVGISVAVVTPAGATERFGFGSAGVGTDLTAAPVRAWLIDTSGGEVGSARMNAHLLAVAAAGLGLVLFAAGAALACRRRAAQRGGRTG